MSDSNTQDDNHNGDELLEEYLRGDSSIGSAYSQLDPVEPSATLDQNVMELAKADLEKTRSRPRSPLWGSRLDSPFALAAVVVLCASLVLIFSQQEELTDVSDIPADVQIRSAPEEFSAEREFEQDDMSGQPSTKVQRQMAPASEDIMMDNTDSATMMQEAEESAPISSSIIEMKNEQKSAERQTGIDQSFKLNKKMEQRSLQEGASLKGKISSDILLINTIKQLISKGNLKKAREQFKNLKEQIPDLHLEDFFTDHEISVLQE